MGMFVGVAAFLAQAVLGMLAKVGTRSRTSVSGCEALPIVPGLHSGSRAWAEAWFVAWYLALL
jgi:hypothetical protein